MAIREKVNFKIFMIRRAAALKIKIIRLLTELNSLVEILLITINPLEYNSRGKFLILNSFDIFQTFIKTYLSKLKLTLT